MKCSKCGTKMSTHQKSCHNCGNTDIFKLNKGNATYLSAFTAIIAVSTIVIILVITFKMDRDSYSISDLASEFTETLTNPSTAVEHNDYDSVQNNDISSYPEPDSESTSVQQSESVAMAYEERAAETPIVTNSYDDSYEDYEEVEVEEQVVNDDYDYYTALDHQVENFIIQFRDAYSIALNNDDFSYVEPFLSYDSEAYHEIKEYMGDISGNSYTFDFKENSIFQISTNIHNMSAESYEVFHFTDNVGKITLYERYKTYILLADQSGNWSITNIDITDTSKN
ncbi:zinc ribbon domain-containing protein [Sporosarcina sp. E16_8]|uniref:zinc ribbon domain-containing protein n=1 Tax=Sporosarcina sp. E16_8 TaxID=2789295 RepID=UPI001A93568E|nr:zinc ribbon domain-containing protein [Sporosarcina sp. E16_8]MBO0589488.1 zinc ribbon domain-containing protein [Sporosarcina sp. E16_8]